MAIPVLTTSRLTLRPFTPEDVDALYGILSGPSVLLYFPPGPPPTREVAARMIERIQRHWEERGYGLWAVESRATRELMGRCGLNLVAETGETEVDVILGAAFWGQGFATEAVRESLRYGFDRPGVERIIGIIHPGNAASRRVLEKVGMKPEGPARYFGMDCERYALARPEPSRGPSGG